MNQKDIAIKAEQLAAVETLARAIVSRHPASTSTEGMLATGCVELINITHQLYTKFSVIHTERDALILAFHSYAWHDSSCDIKNPMGPGECDCGFDLARKNVKAISARQSNYDPFDNAEENHE